jgi:hypothetical protein
MSLFWFWLGFFKMMGTGKVKEIDVFPLDFWNIPKVLWRVVSALSLFLVAF